LKTNSNIKIYVVGSINYDLTIRTELPKAEETIRAFDSHITRALGGKGANQAVQARKTFFSFDTSEVYFIGKVGNDDEGKWLMNELEDKYSVNLTFTEQKQVSSGTGIVLLSKDGLASSIVVPGANGPLGWSNNVDDDKELREFFEHIFSSTIIIVGGDEDDNMSCSADNNNETEATMKLTKSILMLQREIPDDVNEIASKTFKGDGSNNSNRIVFLDLGGVTSIVPESLFAVVDIISPNLNELETLVATSSLSYEYDFGNNEDVIRAANDVLKKRGNGNQALLVTLGSRGSFYITGKEEDFIFVEPIASLDSKDVIDCTGAGDSFRGSFAVAIAEGNSIARSMEIASASGTLAVQKMGAAPSLPDREAIEYFLEKNGRQKTEQFDAVTTNNKERKRVNDKEDSDLNFACRLNSMKEQLDDNDTRKKSRVEALLELYATIKGGVSNVELNFPEHVSLSTRADIEKITERLKLNISGLNIRFPKDIFSKGAFMNPSEAIREKAIAFLKEACKVGLELKINHIIVWSQFDGYDYDGQIDFVQSWKRLVLAYKTAVGDGETCALVKKISYEFKPTDALSRFSLIPNTFSALMFVEEVNLDNFGLTLDYAHVLMASENPSQSATMAAIKGKLFGVHLNDAVQSKLGAEDGLAFASVNPRGAYEFIRTLWEFRFDGVFYFDTFPMNESPVKECSRNVEIVKKYWILAQNEKNDLSSLLAREKHDFLEIEGAFYSRLASLNH